MTFSQAVKVCLRKYFTFSGRASRTEFWLWQLFLFLAMVLPAVVMAVLMPVASSFMEALSAVLFVAQVALYIPGLAAISRRLHDIGKSGWWQLLAFVPLIGAVILLVWWVRKGNAGTNRFGDDPLGPSPGTIVDPAAV